SPNRITEPLPNCFSIWASANSSVFCLSATAKVWISFSPVPTQRERLLHRIDRPPRQEPALHQMDRLDLDRAETAHLRRAQPRPHALAAAPPRAPPPRAAPPARAPPRSRETLPPAESRDHPASAVSRSLLRISPDAVTTARSRRSRAPAKRNSDHAARGAPST